MARTISTPNAARCRWLPEEELAVYSSEFSRTGFQGGLQWYRCTTGAEHLTELAPLARQAIRVPATFIAGKSDWGVYQKPGDFERMQGGTLARMQSCSLVEGAGHWVQQEKPEETSRLLLSFLKKLAS